MWVQAMTTNPSCHLSFTQQSIFLMAARVILYFVKRTVLLSRPNPSVVPRSPWDTVQIVSCMHHSLCGGPHPVPYMDLSLGRGSLTHSPHGSCYPTPLCLCMCRSARLESSVSPRSFYSSFEAQLHFFSRSVILTGLLIWLFQNSLGSLKVSVVSYFSSYAAQCLVLKRYLIKTC